MTIEPAFIRIRSYVFVAGILPFVAVGTQSLTAGTIADMTSDCTGGCTSITYSGAPGAAPSGNAFKIVSPLLPIWADMSDFGLTGDWISYGQTSSNGTSGQPIGSVDFTVNYTVDPAWNVNRVVFNVLADDFSQITSAPANFGPMPGWGSQISPHCSSNPPGCQSAQLYTQTLSAQEMSMFLTDTQLTFTVTQLIDNTPFGLAFDIQLFNDSVVSSPEPGTLGMIAAPLVFGWAALRRRRRTGSRRSSS